MTGNLKTKSKTGVPFGGNLKMSPMTCGPNVRFTQKHNNGDDTIIYDPWKYGVKPPSYGIK